jgi:rhamnosyltransferase
MIGSDQMDCLILMASYNGAIFIRQQVESIINQTFNDWKLIIRDDGSNDGTREILKEIESNEKRITVLENNFGKHGAYLNFWTLIQYAHLLKEYDYYFFADQDDIWAKNKLQIMINYAEESGCNDAPLMLYSDMEIIDEKNKQLLPSINNVMGSGKMNGLSLFFTHGFIWGCSAMINKSLFKAAPIFPLDDSYIDIMSHDNYYGKFAIMLGTVKFINQPLIRHRRHSDNTTGEYKLKLNLASVLKKAFFHFDDLAKTHARVYNQTLLTLRQMEQVGLDREEIAIIRDTIKKGGLKGTYRLKKFNVKRKQFSRTIGIYFVMLLGSYKKYLIEI